VTPFRVRTLSEAPSVSLALFDHPHGAALDEPSAEQAAARLQINVVRSGWFRLGYEGREWTLGEGSLFLSRPGDLYTYAHLRHVEPDACLSLAFSPAAAAGGELARVFARLPLVPPITNRLAFLRLRLASQTRDDVRDDLDDFPLSLETLAFELVDAPDVAAERARDDRSRRLYRLYRPRQLQWYADRIGAARDLMDASPAGPHSLASLAAHVAMSPFAFARVFRELVGVPPHRYLMRARLKRARALLESGTSVTAACYAAGFNNLSHFIRTFRAHFGTAPSEVKAPRR
jgi:AraC-like DNA-binding protein